MMGITDLILKIKKKQTFLCSVTGTEHIAHSTYVLSGFTRRNQNEKKENLST